MTQLVANRRLDEQGYFSFRQPHLPRTEPKREEFGVVKDQELPLASGRSGLAGFTERPWLD